jgi:RNA polymerase sigma factor (TIGR02999 family)
MSDITQLLSQVESGKSKAAEELLPLVYEELRRIAARKMALERAGQTLQPTALVHEAWLRLTGNSQQQWTSSGHFLAAAAEAMRRILIDDVRRKNRVRHGGDLLRVDLYKVEFAADVDADTLQAVEEAIQKFSVEEPVKAPPPGIIPPWGGMQKRANVLPAH